MSIQYDMQILRSKLIAMTRLTQRTVDYSIKAFQLGRLELCRAAQNSREEMSAIRGWIANHGRALLATGTAADADTHFVCAALRIATALEVACDAAFNIAKHSAIRLAEGWSPVSAELEEAGNFVNNLLRLCILSLLERDVRHAKAVLQNGNAAQSLDLAVYLAHRQDAPRISTHARFELALVRSLDEIAGQVREIADAFMQWHDEVERKEIVTNDAPNQTAEVAHRCKISVSKTDLPCKTLVFWSTLPPRNALRLNPPDNGCIPSRGFAEAVPTEDFTPARMMGLQQRVCELLVKNQQLRMALIAERADIHHDQLC
jgi:phosphate uptake regulator